MKRLLRLIFVLIFGIVNQLNAQNCGEILEKGIYDFRETTSDLERTESFVFWFRQQNFSSYEKTSRYLLDIGIPLGDVLFGLYGSADNKQFQQFKSDIENFEKLEKTRQEQISIKLREINPSVVKAWENCVSLPGKVHFWIISNSKADPCTFILCAQYFSDGGNLPKMTSFSITPKENIEFEDGGFVNSKGKPKKVVFKGGVISQAFRRKQLGPLTITINTSRGNGFQTQLAAISRNRVNETLPEIKIEDGQIQENADLKNTCGQADVILQQWQNLPYDHKVERYCSAFYITAKTNVGLSDDKNYRWHLDVFNQCIGRSRPGPSGPGGKACVAPNYRTTINLPVKPDIKAWGVVLSGTSKASNIERINEPIEVIVSNGRIRKSFKFDIALNREKKELVLDSLPPGRYNLEMTMPEMCAANSGMVDGITDKNFNTTLSVEIYAIDEKKQIKPMSNNILLSIGLVIALAVFGFVSLRFFRQRRGRLQN
ncbi:hypothetical protein HUK80_07690 [Flavobacterium sp. MAH-1]|uniref:Uncharacterized protein n=1 Tax=Flavobacterium agri TaxID=2743471 RepID=A0A7Y8Y1F3_9FLAO|nr:hypothetical protein [Flavobacterium agri]NUY80769.1 hypothetical protein [Flavobacterium agri]NYA70793.1 hypothetical protein [Flavobacterium agri]